MKPAETQVLDEVELRLGSITKANGYSMTLRSIERGKLEPFQPGDIPATNFWPVRHARDNTEYGLDKHTLRVMVDARDTERDTNFPDAAALMIADIITALHRDPEAPKVSDPLDCEFKETVTSVNMADSGYQIGTGQKPWVGAIVEVEIVYESELGDMFNYQP